MNTERVLLALAIALSITLIALLCWLPSGREDLWWTLAVGDYVRTTGDVPRTALWTIDAVRDLPYVCPGWLAALVFSGVAHWFGLDALPFVPTLVALTVFAIAVALARRTGTSWLLSVAIADLVLWHFTRRMFCRTEVFGYLYFGLALLALAAYTRSQRIRYLAVLVVLALLWVNFHGSFPLLLALVPLFAAGSALDAWRRSGFRREDLLASLFSRRTAALGATWLLIAATTMINPYGIELVREILDPSGSDSLTQYIKEWDPLYAQTLPLYFVVSAGVLLAALAAGFRRVSFVSVLLAVFVIALWLSAQRHIALFGIGAALVLGDFASGVTLGPRGRKALAASLVAALLGAHVWFASELRIRDRSLTRHPSPDITVEGLDFIRSHVRGNVLNSYSLGGLLIYFTYPQARVSIDSRIGPYPAWYFRSYLRALYGTPHHARAFVDRYAIDHIVLDRKTYRKHFRFKQAALPEFALAYWDDRTVVLSRSSPGGEGEPTD